MSADPAMTREDCDPQKAADLLRALAHPMRLRILCRLLDGELSVAGFEGELGLKQPNLSQQLGHLRDAALVTTRREAKSIIYRLSDHRVRGILDAVRLAMASADIPTQTPARPLPARPLPAPPLPAPPLPARPVVARLTATAARAVPAPGECGVFAVAGWSGASRQGSRSLG